MQKLVIRAVHKIVNTRELTIIPASTIEFAACEMIYIIWTKTINTQLRIARRF